MFAVLRFIVKMSTEEKRLHIVEFSGKKCDYDAWVEIFKAHGKRKGYTKLLLGKETIRTQSEIITMRSLILLKKNKKLVKLGKPNELGYEDLILSINATTSAAERCLLTWSRTAKTKPTIQKVTAS